MNQRIACSTFFYSITGTWEGGWRGDIRKTFQYFKHCDVVITLTVSEVCFSRTSFQGWCWRKWDKLGVWPSHSGGSGCKPELRKCQREFKRVCDETFMRENLRDKVPNSESGKVRRRNVRWPVAVPLMWLWLQFPARSGNSAFLFPSRSAPSQTCSLETCSAHTVWVWRQRVMLEHLKLILRSDYLADSLYE